MDNGVSYNGSTADFDSVSVGSIPAIPVNFGRGVFLMKKGKLFAICLTIALMASGCAESKSIGESSEMSNADVEIEISELAENKEESKEEASSIANLRLLEISEVSEVEHSVLEESEEQSVSSEPEKIPYKTEEPKQVEEIIFVSSERIELETSDTISNAEESIEEIPEVTEQTSEEQIPEIPESEREHSTIPNDEAIIRYNPLTSTDDEKWWYEMDGTEESEEEIQIWAITQCECMTCDGDIIEEGTYVRVLWNDLDDEYCVIQWYDSEENISEHGLQMFEIFESDTHEIIANKKTAGIIIP